MLDKIKDRDGRESLASLSTIARKEAERDLFGSEGTIPRLAQSNWESKFQKTKT